MIKKLKAKRWNYINVIPKRYCMGSKSLTNSVTPQLDGNIPPILMVAYAWISKATFDG